MQLNVDAASEEVRNWIQTKDLHEHGPGWAKLTRSASSSSLESPGRVHTRRVKVDEALLFGSMMCKGFNFPLTLVSLWSAIVGKEGWSCFFALDGETPIGIGPSTYPGHLRGWVVAQHSLSFEIAAFKRRSSRFAPTTGSHKASRRSSSRQKCPHLANPIFPMRTSEKWGSSTHITARTSSCNTSMARERRLEPRLAA